MAFNIFLCVILGLSVQRVVGSCDNATLNEVLTLLNSLPINNMYHNFTEAYSIICSYKTQQDLVKNASKLEPCLEVYMDKPLLRGLAVPYMRRVLKKVSQQYMTDVCQAFQGVLDFSKTTLSLNSTYLMSVT